MRISLVHNIWLKLLALALGVLLWLHVATEKLYTYEITLPVDLVSVHEGMQLMAKPIDSLRVTVEARGKQLLRRQWRHRGLRIMANHLQAGTYPLDLNAANVTFNGDAQGIVLKGIVQPTTINVQLDERVIESMPVQVELKPEVAPGFAITKISEPFPTHVLVTGPKAQIKEAGKVKTVEQVLPNLRDSARIYLSLHRPEYTQWDIAPESVAVSVLIEPVQTRTFSRIPIVVFNPPADSSIIHHPATVDVDISAPSRLVNQTEMHSIVASVDYAKRNPVSHKAAVKVDCPVGIHASKWSVDSVQFSK